MTYTSGSHPFPIQWPPTYIITSDSYFQTVITSYENALVPVAMGQEYFVEWFQMIDMRPVASWLGTFDPYTSRVNNVDDSIPQYCLIFPYLNVKTVYY